MTDESEPAREEPEPPALPVRGPLQGLQDLSQIITSHPVNTGSFVRGLTIGALVGAAIAGSAIWRRWRRGGNSKRGDRPD